jgi:HK97 gp10 family phage protein
MSVTVTGDADLRRKLLMLGDQMTDAAAEGVFLTANEVRNSAIKSIQEQTFGTPVTRSRQGGGTYPHIASAPGNAPNTDTGKLVSSIAVEKTGDTEHEVGTNLDYGEYLEMGTKFMFARPWLIPALDLNRNNMLSNIEKAVDLRLKKLAK